MPERVAIYFAPAQDSVLDLKASAWLARKDIASLTLSARRYGFHATIKAPMALKPGKKAAELAADLKHWCSKEAPVNAGRIEVRHIDGFLALVPVAQPEELTNLAGRVVEDFDRFRAPLDPKDRAKRLRAPLTDRQIKLLDKFGYPYVLEQFQFHLTLTDRLPPAQAAKLLAEARAHFTEVTTSYLLVDRLVLFHERQQGGDFDRGEEFVLGSGHG